MKYSDKPLQVIIKLAVFWIIITVGFTKSMFQITVCTFYNKQILLQTHHENLVYIM